MSQSLFSSQEDHEFYDKECPAHKQLKVSTSFSSVPKPMNRVRLTLPSSQETTGKARFGPSSVMTLVTEGEWPEPKL